MSQMHPDLMGAAGLKPAVQQAKNGGRAKCFNQPRTGHGMPPAREQDRLPLTVGLVTSQLGRQLQNIAGLKAYTAHPTQPWIARIGHTVDQRTIDPLDSMGFELRSESVMSCVAFRHNQKAGRILVDPMNDPRPLCAADTRQAIAAMVHQRIDQRPRGRAGCRMHDHARRLVDDDQMIILEDDIKRDVFGQQIAFHCSGDCDFHRIPCVHAGLGIGDNLPSNLHAPLFDQPHKA